MPSAEIITIGTEILLGEIVDTNTRYLSRKLREQGIDLFRQTTVGDNIERIAQAIQNSLPNTDVIITTGGLGPTIDDPTRQAIALAVGVQTEFREELWEQVKERYRRFGRVPTENNKRQAYVPQGAIAVENPVGTAPAFIVETKNCSVIALPGVPREMEHLMEHQVIPYLSQRLDLKSVIKSRLIHTSGVGESQIDDRIGDLELLDNPTVGLAAHSGRVDIRITAKAESEDEALGMIEEIEKQVVERLGDWIFGADEDTLEQAALSHLKSKGWTLAVVEAGLDGELIHRLASASGPFSGGQLLTKPNNSDNLVEILKTYRKSSSADVVLGVTLHYGEERQRILLAVITPSGDRQVPLSYGGPRGYASTWAVNQSLDLLRKL
ncbi:MAG: CinA family nicotinamide mononucleotide deamidase-related protein [Chloroflexota bacterium]|nr:MAG: CinA family nicotinamide mononucleotide deamidase-related protein [Chloroflexota bacterium]